jgi:hypothetical protein
LASQFDCLAAGSLGDITGSGLQTMIDDQRGGGPHPDRGRREGQ